MRFGAATLQAWLAALGAGGAGAPGWSAEVARDVFEALLSGALGELEAGALLTALHIKGESIAEVEGAMAALAPHVRAVPVDPARPVVVVPSYGGALRQANLVPLLACLLADHGLQVVVHGPREAPGRTTTAQVLQAMGLADAFFPADPGGVLARQLPVFVPVDVLSPPLAWLLGLRRRLGVRNIGHLLCRLLEPTGVAGALQLASFADPATQALQRAWFERRGGCALVAAGGQGEVVADLRRAPPLDWVHDGRTERLTPCDPQGAEPMPALPHAGDARATAHWIQSVLAGERPVPSGIDRQVRRVVELSARGAATAA